MRTFAGSECAAQDGPPSVPAGRGSREMTGPGRAGPDGIVSVQLGAGVATRLFHQLAPATVTGLRLWSAALILLIRGRPGSLGGQHRRGGPPGLA